MKCSCLARPLFISILTSSDRFKSMRAIKSLSNVHPSTDSELAPSGTYLMSKSSRNSMGASVSFSSVEVSARREISLLLCHEMTALPSNFRLYMLRTSTPLRALRREKYCCVYLFSTSKMQICECVHVLNSNTTTA